MKITFLGTGEACDEKRSNTSILVENGSHLHLLDCGFTSTPALLRQKVEAKELKTVWISHFHGDHFFGLAQLLVFYYQQKRKEPLTIISGENGASTIRSLVELAYPGLFEKLLFALDFVELHPGKELEHHGLRWQSAKSLHSQSSFAIRISGPNHSLYYSGDGKPTEECEELMAKSDLVIHEAFLLEPGHPTHCSIHECMDLAARLDIPQLALVHISRETWQQLMEKERPLSTIPLPTNLCIPKDCDTLHLDR